MPSKSTWLMFLRVLRIQLDLLGTLVIEIVGNKISNIKNQKYQNIKDLQNIKNQDFKRFLKPTWYQLAGITSSIKVSDFETHLVSTSWNNQFNKGVRFLRPTWYQLSGITSSIKVSDFGGPLGINLLE